MRWVPRGTAIASRASRSYARARLGNSLARSMVIALGIGHGIIEGVRQLRLDMDQGRPGSQTFNRVRASTR
jgi:hypothetical protein